MNQAIADLFERSASPRELVLPYREAVEALLTLELQGAVIRGWEGWLRYSDGRLGHSARHQGTVDLTGLRPDDVMTLCRSTMAEAVKDFAADPEHGASDLLFCVTFDGA